MDVDSSNISPMSFAYLISRFRRSANQRRKMFIGVSTRLFSILFLSVVLISLTGCTGNASSKAEKGKGKKGGDNVLVTIAKVARRDVPVEIQVIGNVEAYSTVVVKAQVTGLLEKVDFHEGDFVRKGDELFSIDPSS